MFYAGNAVRRKVLKDRKKTKLPVFTGFPANY
ncbi:hypothetical protein NIASO_15110 [Niabella soli DSM 19437]|uniref:Uncharacterized protein n=1 Tax=Niabella soli DSM 19437 TaxID=929713 RepID=W0F8Q2_9BACT|nr:hypothetical protein NIASO_15110 [Niabella soli DSM 19437]